MFICYTSLDLQQSHLAVGVSQLFSTAASAAAPIGPQPPAHKGTATPLKELVQVCGDKGLAEVETNSDVTVAHLGDAIITKLDLDARPSGISLCLAKVDETTDEVNSVSETRLLPRHTLAEAHVGNIAVKVVRDAVTASTALAATTGACTALHGCLYSCNTAY